MDTDTTTSSNPRFRGAYGRALALAIGVWSVHFWALAGAFVWLPLEILVLVLPAIVGSAVVLVWRIEKKMQHQIDIFTHGVRPTLVSERAEPRLPQPQSGWTWQHAAQGPAIELAETDLRREAA